MDTHRRRRVRDRSAAGRHDVVPRQQPPEGQGLVRLDHHRPRGADGCRQRRVPRPASVSLSAWKDIWLNEGFATYAEWLHAEQHGGRSAQKTFDALYASPASSDLWAFPPADPGNGAHIFDTPVYLRGAMALQRLRTAVGDKVFFHILRAWATEHRYGHGTTAQFIGLAERESGEDLGGLFHTWLCTGKPSSA